MRAHDDRQHARRQARKHRVCFQWFETGQCNRTNCRFKHVSLPGYASYIDNRPWLAPIKLAAGSPQIEMRIDGSPARAQHFREKARRRREV